MVYLTDARAQYDTNNANTVCFIHEDYFDAVFKALKKQFAYVEFGAGIAEYRGTWYSTIIMPAICNQRTEIRYYAAGYMAAISEAQNASI